MRWKIISILVTSFLLIQANAQSLEQTREIADQAFSRGDYNLALNAYQRVLYFGKKNPSPKVFYNIGEAHYERGNYEKALVYFDRAYYASVQDSLQHKAVFGKIRALLQQRQWDLALAEIYSEEDYVNPEDRQRMEYFKGLCFFAKEDFEASEEAFIKAIDNKDTLRQNSIEAIFDDDSRLHRPNPNTARILSYFFPGAGQMYVGDVESSLNSLLLNAGLAALFIHTSMSFSLVDAMVSVIPWFQRYYLGGSFRAELLAEAKREEKRREVLRDVLQVIEE